MKKPIMAFALGCATIAAMPALVPAASAQTRAEQRRWDVAEDRFEREQALYERERDLYERARARSGYRGGPNGPGGPGGPGGYNGPGGPGGYNGPTGAYSSDPDRYRTEYDASRYYRDDARYTERRLGSNDEVYRGSDGRYYCKRSDGTTGLIIGAAGGALLGNVIDGGRNRAAGTLIGGALGALLGRSVEQQNAEVRCR
jgi:hypothetical protein